MKKDLEQWIAEIERMKVHVDRGAPGWTTSELAIDLGVTEGVADALLNKMHKLGRLECTGKRIIHKRNGHVQGVDVYRPKPAPGTKSRPPK